MSEITEPDFTVWLFVTGVCDWCGGEFNPRQTTQNFCSNTHRERYRRSGNGHPYNRSIPRERKKCQVKGKYKDWEQAEKNALRIFWQTGRKLSSYKCKVCHYYHHTSKGAENEPGSAEISVGYSAGNSDPDDSAVSVLPSWWPAAGITIDGETFG